jgi:hypothetical protein
LSFPQPGNPYCTGKLGTVDLLVPTRSDELVFVLKLYLSFFTTTYLNEEVNCTKPFPSVRVPCSNLQEIVSEKLEVSGVMG